MKKQYFFFLCILLFFVLNTFTQEKFPQKETDIRVLLPFLSEGEITELISGRALDFVSKKNQKNRLLYIPHNPVFDEVTTFVMKKKPTILYETLFLVKTNTEEEKKQVMLKLSNYVREVEVFSSIKYKNIKKNIVHPLFLSSKEVVSVEDSSQHKSIKPLVNLPIERTTENIFVLQDMPPFGQVNSEYIYSHNAFFSTFVGYNRTPIFFKKIKTVNPNEMFTSYYIINTNEGVLVYGMGAVRIRGAANLFGGVITNSFQSRMEGLFFWIQNKYWERPQIQ